MLRLLFACIFFLFVSSAFACLDDSDTSHPASAYNQRLWSYTSSTPKAASTSSDLMFMSFNLQSSYSLACVSSPQAQADLMTVADYIGAQETDQSVDTRCNCNMPQIIANTAGMSTRFFMTLPWRTGQYGITAGSTQTILDQQYSLLNYAGVEQRLVSAIKTQPHALNGRYLWFVNTHVEYYVWAARQAQVTQIVTFIQNLKASDPTAVIVLTGDFNGGPGDVGYTLLSAVMKNSWEVFNGSPANGYTHPSDYPSERFDHVWFYAPSGVSVTVKSFEVVDVELSDHRPVRALLSFAVVGGPTAAPAAPTAAPAHATAAPTAAPAHATAAPTNAAARATAAPTAAPASGTCSASIAYVSSSVPTVITNTGSQAIKNIVIQFNDAIPSNNWNWVSQGSNKFTLPSWAYGSLSSHGQQYSSSGYYTSGTAPTATVVSVSC